MKLADVAALLICCLAWAANFVVSAWALGVNPVPPFMLAALRAAIVLVLMGTFLKGARPVHFWRLMVVCTCVGPLHLGFLYSGLQIAPASASAIVSQLLIPFATILSMIFLKEVVGWVRGLAIIGAFMGTMVMVYQPEAISLDIGLLYIVAAYFFIAVGSVVMKTVGDVDWKEYVAWTAVIMFCMMVPASFFFETGQLQVWQNSKIPLLIAAGYAATCVSIVAHGQYFRLIKTYDVTQVVPVTLLVPLFAAILSVMFLDEVITQRMLIGSALIIPCVFVIAKRQHIAPVAED